MLLEFRLRNYRSFGQESVLSLVASGDRELVETNTAATSIKSLPRAVRSAVVYGANASGKSNLLRAMLLMRGVVVESFSLKPEQLFNVQPFQLDEKLKGAPTLFEITVVLDGVRYQYGFEFLPNRIVSEWLLVYQKAKPQKWFEREFDSKSGEETFTYGPHLTGQKRAWQEATRPNALFLSTAVQLNSEQLKPLHSWFAESLVILLEGGLIPFSFSTNMVQTPEGQKAIKSIMSAADIAISSISAVRQKSVLQEMTFDLATGKSDTRRQEGEMLVPHFRHQGINASADFGLHDESQGTQKLFALAGPLLDIIKNGKTLVIDELDRSLHPLLVRRIINVFQDPKLNERGAQLIFSTHDTTLLDGELLRRDQIWLTEKRSDQSSELVPLTEFSPRKGEALEKGYLSGRYGGVPILRDRLLPGRSRGEK
jgi:AAA15 family ATPase/GTPase